MSREAAPTPDDNARRTRSRFGSVTGMGSRRSARAWGWILIALAGAALLWAGLEWWYQSNGQQVLEGFAPDGVSTIPVEWERERQQSQIRMAVAVLGGAAMFVGGLALLKRLRNVPASVV